MSMMRASGAMPTITALQMATASLATPKSLMKTMVGCGMACPGTGSALLSVRNFEQAPARKTNASKDKATLGIILSLRGPAMYLFFVFLSSVQMTRLEVHISHLQSRFDLLFRLLFSVKLTRSEEHTSE